MLKLDASEFNLSEKELTVSNLISLRSEELLGGAASNQQRQLNSTFQYISAQDKVHAGNTEEGGTGVLSANGVIVLDKGQNDLIRP